jgi:hypothetical protein
MGTRRWDVLRVTVTEAAHAAHRRHTLLVGRESAVRTAAVVTAIIGAPGVVLRQGAVAESTRPENYSENADQELHRSSPPRGSPADINTGTCV